jgi:hypothetical protein
MLCALNIHPYSLLAIRYFALSTPYFFVPFA